MVGSFFSTFSFTVGEDGAHSPLVPFSPGETFPVPCEIIGFIFPPWLPSRGQTPSSVSLRTDHGQRVPTSSPLDKRLLGHSQESALWWPHHAPSPAWVTLLASLKPYLQKLCSHLGSSPCPPKSWLLNPEESLVTPALSEASQSL